MCLQKKPAFTVNFILFDTPHIKTHLLPLTYFRPVSEIRCGILTIKEKWELYLKHKVSYATDAYLQEKFPLTSTDDNIFINAAVFPNQQLIEAILQLNKGELLAHNQDVIAGRTERQELPEINDAKLIHYEGAYDGIKHTYDIFEKNASQIKKDFALITQGKSGKSLSKTNTVIGDYPVFLEEGAKVEACVFNTEDGPVYIGKNAVILEGSLIRGPFAALDNAVVKMGAKIYQGTTIGPNSKVGGEVKGVVFFGNSNKGHDGYLGDSVIAEWCNLGADTNNSNLKNNYSEVKLWNYKTQNFAPTGLQFCGLIMGDHSKCGIATMFNTGTVVGVSSNIFGADYQPKFFPSFKWGDNNFVNYRYDKAKEVSQTVMQRRNIVFDDIEQRLFENVYKLTQEKE